MTARSTGTGSSPGGSSLGGGVLSLGLGLPPGGVLPLGFGLVGAGLLGDGSSVGLVVTSGVGVFDGVGDGSSADTGSAVIVSAVNSVAAMTAARVVA
ncbi:MAG TPA: hypothetical protein VHJ83_03585 [Micromonosporaceae bacterium]|nr:hypothetical protein [Micromonosporaceae bacterium]